MPQATPDGRELIRPASSRVTGDPGAVDRADAGADHEVRPDAPVQQGLQHAGLDCAETGPARQYERGAHTLITPGLAWCTVLVSQVR